MGQRLLVQDDSRLCKWMLRQNRFDLAQFVEAVRLT